MSTQPINSILMTIAAVGVAGSWYGAINLQPKALEGIEYAIQDITGKTMGWKETDALFNFCTLDEENFVSFKISTIEKKLFGVGVRQKMPMDDVRIELMTRRSYEENYEAWVVFNYDSLKHKTATLYLPEGSATVCKMAQD